LSHEDTATKAEAGMSGADTVALKWIARVFLAIGLAAAIGCAFFVVRTLRFVSESELADGTVVDWTQGQGSGAASPEPGAYYPVIEIVLPDGRRTRGEAEVGVALNQLEIGERVRVRYHRGDSAHMRVVSLFGLWLEPLVAGALTLAFSAAGLFLSRQSR
jgi:hypothetical protein